MKDPRYLMVPLVGTFGNGKSAHQILAYRLLRNRHDPRHGHLPVGKSFFTLSHARGNFESSVHWSRTVIVDAGFDFCQQTQLIYSNRHGPRFSCKPRSTLSND